MKNKVLYTFIICALGVQILHAQTVKNPWGISIAPSTYSFYALRDGSNFFKGEDYGVGVALGLQRYAGRSFDLGLSVGLGRVRHPLDASASRADQRESFLHTQLGIKYKLNNGYILSDKSMFSPYLHTGFGGNTYGEFKDWYMHVPVGAGLQVNFKKVPASVFLQTAYNVAVSGESFLHHQIGVVVNFGKSKKKGSNLMPEKNDDTQNDNLTANLDGAADNDFDGVPNEIDRCPNIYGSPLTFGCPDSDGDGVPDADDRCPDEKGFANLMGCADRDNDGVIDPDDQCPDVYGFAPTGCPSADENDLDGDGVPNEVDKCPDVKGSFTANGCPDSDGDGIADDEDLCPDYYGVAEHDGCPLPKEEMDRMKRIYNNQILAKKYDISDARNPYNPRNDEFDPTDPYNPFNPNNPAFDVTHVDNPYNPDHIMFDINDINNPYNTASANYNPKYQQIKPYDPNRNPADLDPNDPANYGRIVIGNATSDKYGSYNNKGKNTANNSGKGNKNNNQKNNSNPNTYNSDFSYVNNNPGNLTGFAESVNLTPEEEAYCNRLDLEELKAAIYFETGNSIVNSYSLRSLEKIVDAMRRCAILEVQIAGHTDSDGADDFNMTLSEKRAKSVLKYITGEGISDRRLKYNAYGEQYPTVPNNTPENKQQNRRAEIKVIKTK